MAYRLEISWPVLTAEAGNSKLLSYLECAVCARSYPSAAADNTISSLWDVSYRELGFISQVGRALRETPSGRD